MADPAYGAVDLPDVWGVDTAIAGALTDAQIVAVLASRLKNGQRIRFVWGYLPLPGASPSHWDMSAARMKAWADHGAVVLLVQHCPSGLWTASGVRGREAGEHAGAIATSLGYPKDAHVAFDDEAIANPGPDAFANVSDWCDAMRATNLPCVYEGFQPGLTPAREYAIPTVDRYWGAAGSWDVATRSVCCRQGLQETVAGVAVDPDHAFPDKLGGVLRGFARLDLWVP